MKKSIAAAAAVAVLAAGGGIVYATGAFDSWRDGRALADACGEMVDASQMERLLGADRVSGRNMGSLGCRAFDPGGKASLTVTVERGSSPDSVVLHTQQILARDQQSLLVPVGGGWPVMVSIGGGAESYATALLPCGKVMSEDDLVLSMTAVRSGSGGGVQERREALAALVTRALERAAAAEGCESADRDKPHVRAGAFADLQKSGEATGTCRETGLPSYETEADGTAPIEQCVLAGDGGERTFRLAAYYGPYPTAPRRDPLRGPYDYVGPSGTTESKSWTTASCAAGQALYTMEALDPRTPASDQVRQAFRAFAAESATRHGCVAPLGVDQP
ncbi:hypothetical protein OG594_16900 [Streptomyces sp. NBC_01214]|uniref:hypothetical protein n=1 Tax=Streptomyces sp. NBC_01214 TaxID=2903777 RepID=UPI0022549376|nr:hypothetical protein [Streptomyces sp. NBC_01214]MCX4803309.1 hypothetical protein [Streptomyces sp. NBC_01214]